MSLDLGPFQSLGCASGISRMTGGGFGSSAQERSLSLLLLEDDEALRQMLLWELSDLGYRVHPTASCVEARAANAAGDFDLALMDVGLPDGDGAALAAELIGACPKLKVVLCSGRPDNLARERIPSAVIACLSKPVCVRRLDALFRDRV